MTIKLSTILFFLIVIVLLIAINGSLSLSIIEFNKKNVCPKIIGIPACYLVLMFFVLTLVAHILQSTFSTNLWFYGFVGFPFLMALGGTLTELSGTVICPRTPGGIPMCYISLGMCILLILLKIGENILR